MRVREIDVKDVKRKLDNREQFAFIDVREPHEHRFASIPGARLIPLSDLPRRISELDPGSETIVHCRSGVRSAQACSILLNAGFANVLNMKGGILAWSSQVDPNVPRY